jgi:putative methyltransferase (TIGR04325 family)
MISLISPMRAFVKDVTPPLILRTYWRLRDKSLRFDGDFTNWEEASSRSSGYDSDEIFEKTRAAALKVKSGDAAFDRDSVVFDHVEYSFPMLAALLRVACAKQGRLRVLDFGGSLGTGYRQFKAFCPGMAYLAWKVVDQPRIVECGKDLFRNDELDFFRTIEEAVRDESPDVILLSSVLQYLENPYAVIGKIISLDAASIMIDRTPIADFDRDVLTVQTVPVSIYRANYPCWIFSRRKLISAFIHGYSLLSEAHDACGMWRYERGTFGFDGFILSKPEK